MQDALSHTDLCKLRMGPADTGEFAARHYPTPLSCLGGHRLLLQPGKLVIGKRVVIQWLLKSAISRVITTQNLVAVYQRRVLVEPICSYR